MIERRIVVDPFVVEDRDVRIEAFLQKAFAVVQPQALRRHAGDLADAGIKIAYARSSAGPDHVTLQALITWLIKSRSRD